jgi:hypothetical protein
MCKGGIYVKGYGQKLQDTSYVVLVCGFPKDLKAKEPYLFREDDRLFVNSHSRRSRWPPAGHNGGASGEERHD